MTDQFYRECASRDGWQCGPSGRGDWWSKGPLLIREGWDFGWRLWCTQRLFDGRRCSTLKAAVEEAADICSRHPALRYWQSQLVLADLSGDAIGAQRKGLT